MTKMKEENLIGITVNQAGFEYDIHSLVKAFYPAQDVKVFTENEKEESSGPGLPDLHIHFTKEAVLLTLIEIGRAHV